MRDEGLKLQREGVRRSRSRKRVKNIVVDQSCWRVIATKGGGITEELNECFFKSSIVFPKKFVWIGLTSGRRECYICAKVLYSIFDEGVVIVSDPGSVDIEG